MNSPVRSIQARTAFVWLTLSALAGCSDSSGTTDTVFPHGGSTAAEGGSNNPAQGGSNNGNGGTQSGGNNNGSGGASQGGNNANGGAQSGGNNNGSGGASQGGNNNARGGASGGFSFGSGGASQGGTSFGKGGASSGGASSGGRNSGGNSAGGNATGGSASGGKSSGGASSGGANSGGASAGAGGDPFAVAAKCTSGVNWTSGNGANMRPGEPCVGCHRFTIAGTVYPTGHEPNDCNGVGTSASATVVVTDAKGTMLRLSVNSAGNFYSSTTITTPYTAVVQTSKGARAMTAPQTNGNCNSCHTQNGSNGAPGRIVIP